MGQFSVGIDDIRACAPEQGVGILSANDDAVPGAVL